MISPSRTSLGTSETVKRFPWKVLQYQSSSLDLAKEFEPHNFAATAIGQSPLIDLNHTSITIVSTSVILLPAAITLTSFSSVNIRKIFPYVILTWQRRFEGLVSVWFG